MLYLELQSAEHLNQTNVLNLVLDQHKRQKDLYFNIRVFSMVPFNVNRSQMNFKFTQRIEVPQCPGGGVPSSPFFYKNLYTLDLKKYWHPYLINTIKMRSF